MSTLFNRLKSRLRDWFNRLTGIQRFLATIAALIITIGAVATAITATLDLANRLGIGGLSAVYLGVEVQDVVVQTAAYEERPAAHTPVSKGEFRVRRGNILPPSFLTLGYACLQWTLTVLHRGLDLSAETLSRLLTAR